MLQQPTGPRGWRAWALIVLGVYLGAVLITPAQAHFTQSISHIINHAKNVFYTKTQSNSRFVNAVPGTEKAPDADKLDNIDSTGFLQNQGSIKVAAFKPWKVFPASGATVDDNFFAFTFFNSSVASSPTLFLIPDLPATLYGRSLQLTGMQLCYDATPGNVTLSSVALLRTSSNTGNSTSGNFVVNDGTDRDDSTCRTYAGTPQTLAPNSWAEVQLGVVWTGSGTFTVNRLTLFLEPTASEIGPLPGIAGSQIRRV